MCAVTLDGKIAKNQGEFINWTGQEDKKLFATETKKAGVVIMGHNTYKTIGHQLKDRLNIVLTSTVSDKTSQPGILEFTAAHPRRILEDLDERNFKTVFVVGGAAINALFLKEKLVTEIWLSFVPKIFGRGINLTEEVDEDVNLDLLSLEKLADGLIFAKFKVLL